jgi:hypothetical protein
VQQRTKRSRIQALILFCALTGVYLSSVIGLLISPVQVSPAAPGHILLLARLSLTDSAIVRLEKRALNPESKTFRRQTPVALLHSGSEPGLLVVQNEQARAFQDKRCNSLTAISPPSDRAPPRPSV